MLKPESKQASKEASKQASQQAIKQSIKQASKQVGKQASQQASKQGSQPASKQAKEGKERDGIFLKDCFCCLFFLFSSLASVAFVGLAFVALPFFTCLSIYLI